MRRIEDYALIGDCESAALVGRDGSIDWLCWPSFDSDPCFAALVGEADNGRWRIAPAETVHETQRRYLPQSLVLETRFRTASGVLVLTDFMPLRGEAPDVVRMLRCESGCVRVRSELALRFDYGRIQPWLTLDGQEATAVAGPHAIRLAARVPLEDEEGACVAAFELAAGEETAFVLTHYHSPEAAPEPVEPQVALGATLAHWRDWVGGCRYEGPWREAVIRSLITLKALTFAPTGGVLAAPTTSLPEDPRGGRTWDYRYCWLRDATFTLMSLLYAGFTREAGAWRSWLLRAVAGAPADIQPVYTVRGERRLAEWEAPWLAGFHGQGPVRFGNAAADQWQLDVLGEVVDALYQAARHGVPLGETERRLVPELVAQVERCWREPDHGLWEMRGKPRRFTHSQVMAWVAVDRAIKLVDRLPSDVPLDRWRKLRARIRDEICRDCYDAEQGCFTQAAGSSLLDAGVLLIPHMGFLPARDPRMVRTVSAICDTLMRDGLVHRYDARDVEDGLGGGESPFLACTFWYADNLILQGRREEGREVFERLLALRNDVGLLSEEYDPVRGQMGGNFPQALSHLSLVNTAFNLQGRGPAHARGDGEASQPHPQAQEDEPCLAPR